MADTEAGLLLAALLAALTLGVPHGPDAPGGLAVVEGAAALAGLIATAVRALRLKPDELRRTVYQVTDRRVLVTTGAQRTWAAYLDQLAEPAVVPQRDGTADLTLRARDKFSLSTLANGGPSPRAFSPGMQPAFCLSARPSGCRTGPSGHQHGPAAHAARRARRPSRGRTALHR